MGDSPLKSDPSHLAALQDDRKDLYPGGARPVGTVRVDLSHERQLLSSAVCWEGSELKFPLIVDEPPSRGGDGSGPAPLSYFVAGAAACLLTQLSKLALLRELEVDSISMTAHAHFDRKLDGSFTDVTFDVKMTGTEDAAAIEAMARDAERQCYASNTLRKAVKLASNIEYNGKMLVRL
jgi:uncharacterized OsmC-like protein